MKVQQYYWNSLSADERTRILGRSQQDIGELVARARPIVERVRDDGDAGLIALTKELDGADISQLGLQVQPHEFEAAKAQLDASLRAALEYAVENVRRFHRAQCESSMLTVQVRPGILASERATPIDRVGLYVPSGRGSFPSMLYMLAVPAVLAGVPTIAVTTPPRPDGTVDPAVLYAAELCGVTTVFRVGGSQAIAALAYGTETVPAVRKITGPGSAWVAAAKRIVSDMVDTGLPAGPSESIVLADATADAHRVALDLMIEAEHGSDSSALLVTSSELLAKDVIARMSEFIDAVPEPRNRFLRDVFSGYGGVIITQNDDESTAVVNRFAPEHLLIHSRDARAWSAQITEAAEVLIGPHTAFSLANYATGPNAVLPTGGWAHSWGPVSVSDFQKRSTVIEVTAEGYDEMRDHVIRLADHEGFYTHAAALRLRDSADEA